MAPIKSAYLPHHPTKEQVRAWQQQRAQEHAPPPGPDEVRRQLGFELVGHVADSRD